MKTPWMQRLAGLGQGMLRVLAINSQLNRIEQKLDAFIAKEGKFEMATQATLDALNATVTANTNATQAAEAALAGYMKTVSDLTAQLQSALTNGDDAQVAAAVSALAANNTALTASIPATAAAVVANTPAA